MAIFSTGCACRQEFLSVAREVWLVAEDVESLAWRLLCELWAEEMSSLKFREAFLKL